MRRLVAACLMASALAAANAEDATPEAGSPKIAMAVFNDAKIEQVLLVVGQQAGVAIHPLGSVAGSRITISDRDTNLETFLNRIALPQGWVWFKMENGDYGLADESWYKRNELPKKVVRKTFELEHIAPSYIEKTVAPMLTSGISTMVADDRTSKLIVTDLPEVQERIEGLLKELDVAVPTEDAARRAVEMEQRAKQLEEMKAKVRAEATPAPEQAAPAAPKEAVARTSPDLPRLTGSWKDAPMQQFLDAVAEALNSRGMPATGVGSRYIARGAAADATVTLEAKEEFAAKVLETVINQKNLILCANPDGTGHLVCDTAWYAANVPGDGIAEVDFVPTQCTAEYVADALRSFANGRVLVSVAPDGKTVRLKGPAQEARHLESWAPRLDTPVSSPPTREERLRLHENRVRYIIESRRLESKEKEGAAAPAPTP